MRYLSHLEDNCFHLGTHIFKQLFSQDTLWVSYLSTHLVTSPSMKQIKFAYFAMSQSISVTNKVLLWFGLFVFKLFYL